VSAQAAIEVENLVREFRKGPRAVDGIDLAVSPGEIYGFLGPIGAGKSTTVLMLPTLLPPTSARAEDVGAGVADAVSRIRGAWRGRPAPRIRLLPERIPYEQLPAPDPEHPHSIPIGINESRLAPVYLDFAAEPHFLCFADGESGKTNLLRTIARGIVARATPEQARIVLVDYRRTLLGLLATIAWLHIPQSPPSAQVQSLTRLRRVADLADLSVRRRYVGSGCEATLSSSDGRNCASSTAQFPASSRYQ